jgi:hypothetical protein
MNRESRIWRRLAIAGAGTIILLVVRVVRGRALADDAWQQVHDLYNRRPRVGDPGEPVDEKDLFTETWRQEIERRLSACESNAAELGELRNAINMHEADLRQLGVERRM